MRMNHNILFAVTNFCDRATIGALCCVSQEARRVAARQLYRTVRVRSLDELVAVHGALARDVWLLPLVFILFCDDALGANARSTAAEPFARRVRAFISGIIPRLTNLEVIVLNCAEFPAELRSLLAARLAVLPRPRSIKLLGMGASNLRAFRASQTPLEHVSIGDYPSSGFNDWLFEYAATLRTLHIGNSHPLVRRLSADPNTPVFPRLHSLALSNGTLNLGAHCARIFPAVRSLSIQRSVGGAAATWPSLEHMDSFMLGPAGADHPRPYGPAMRSLRITYGGVDALERLEDWVSPQISALALVISVNGFAVHVAALGAFSGLRVLDLTLLGDRSETDATTWLFRAVSSLTVVPPHLEVLTLRATTGLHRLPSNPLDTLRSAIPTLRLLRIILQYPPQRLAFAHPRPVDWLSACDIVADYLPHWRETRAPWDDIRDL